MTTVVNLRKEKYDVYIGRGSPFGNPFVIPKDGNRDEVIEKFKVYFYKSHDLQDLALKECKGKVLGCYCKPQKCHGDIIAEFCDSNN